MEFKDEQEERRILGQICCYDRSCREAFEAGTPSNEHQISRSEQMTELDQPFFGSDNDHSNDFLDAISLAHLPTTSAIEKKPFQDLGDQAPFDGNLVIDH